MRADDGGHFQGQTQFPQRTITAVGGNDFFITKLAQPTFPVALTAASDTDKEKAKFRNRLQREAVIDQALGDLDLQDHRLAGWDALFNDAP